MSYRNKFESYRISCALKKIKPKIRGDGPQPDDDSFIAWTKDQYMVKKIN